MPSLHVQMGVPATRASLEAAVRGLVALNVALMRRQGGVPRLYTTRVRYRREPRGVEQWRTADRVVRSGFGDCEDLAAYRAAELIVHRGEPARVIVTRTARRTWHARVQRANGRVEDPSKVMSWLWLHKRPRTRR